MSTDAQPAESSPAAESIAAVTATDHAVVSGDVAAFRAARAAEKAGKPLNVPAESSSAEPGDQAASTEATTAPASEPGKPRKNADSRVQELLSDRARERERADRLEARVRELEGKPTPDAKPAESSPAPAKAAITYPPDLADYDAYLEAHPESSYDDYTDARADHRAEIRDQRKAAAQEEQAARTRQSETVQQRNEKARAQIEDAKKADPAFWDNLSDDVKHLKPFDAIRDPQGRWTERPTGYHALAEEILSSDVAAPLMRHFTDHPEDLHRIAKLPPTALLKEVGRLEARYAKSGESVAPPKTVTDAPPPPTTLGRQSSAPANAADAAVVSGDVSAYRAARLAARVAQLR